MIRILFSVLASVFLPFGMAACEQKEVQPQNLATSHVLSYASPYSQNHPFSRADKKWIEFVQSQSLGEIRIEPIWSGALLSAEMSIEELRYGVADIGLITPIYAAGGSHLIRSQTGFYSGVDTIDDQIALYRCLERTSEQLQHELEGLKVLAVQGGALPGILTRAKPIKTLADLKGLDIRVPAELVEVMRELGANPVSMSMGDVYSALAKGVVDGVVAPEDTFRSLHFAEVATHFTRIKIARGAYPARAISKRVWQNLSVDHQDILTSSIPVWEAAMRDEIIKAKDVGAAFGREHGVKFYHFPADEQVKFDAVYQSVAEKNAKSLARFDIDGLSIYRQARASILAKKINGDSVIQCTTREDKRKNSDE